MARRGRPTVEIKLSGNERKTLERWARRHSSAQFLALRCRIVLACAEGRTNEDIAAELRIHPVTVAKWRKRFAADRLDGLMDAPRPSAVRTIRSDRVGDLAGIRSEALEGGLLQGVPRSRPGGEDPGHRRPLHEPTGCRRGVRGGRGAPDPGPQPDRP